MKIFQSNTKSQQGVSKLTAVDHAREKIEEDREKYYRLSYLSNFADEIPNEPENYNSSTIAGYNKRFSNWKRKLTVHIKDYHQNLIVEL